MPTMMDALFRIGIADLAYRFGLGPRWSDVPDHRLAQVVTGPDALPPGRALDLGCGTGRNARYLARHGWHSVGVELSSEAVRMAERNAAAEHLSVRFIRGDVTRLPELGIGTDYGLLVDGGCYHMIPSIRRDAYISGITHVAAPGALLIMVGFGRHGEFGISPNEIRDRFPKWTLIAADPIPGEQMSQYTVGPALLHLLLRRGALRPMRYQLHRI